MPKNILVIDDDSAHTDHLSLELEKHAYLVSVNNGDNNVFEQINLSQPDLVLLDSGFPNSIDITDFLKLNSLPFIFLGPADIGNNERINYIGLYGALGLLLKPINIQQLIIEIETAIHWHWEKMQLNRRKENIDKTIKNNRQISMAIGILMERYKLKGPDAFEILRGAARNKQCRIIDGAEKIISNYEQSLIHPDTEHDSDIEKNPKQKDLYLGQILNKIERLIG